MVDALARAAAATSSQARAHDDVLAVARDVRPSEPLVGDRPRRVDEITEYGAQTSSGSASRPADGCIPKRRQRLMRHAGGLEAPSY